jgi:2,5-diamino-6-(ribosylamino)-4(3H)-pyrimidinone 5'-phosphate reductase
MHAPSARPRVICHMASSIDGRIVVDGWPGAAAVAVRRAYAQVHASLAADGWICGRVTMEPLAGGMRSGAEVALEYGGGVPREDYRAPGDHDSFPFAVDPRGRLACTTNDIDGDHEVVILSPHVSDDYLAFLRDRSVSYWLAGGDDVDLPVAL